MAFLSYPGSLNEVDTFGIQVRAISIPVSTVISHENTANLSDATMYAFLTNQPNGSQLVHEDLKQIHEDDLEEIDLKWQLALLSIRARRIEFNTSEFDLATYKRDLAYVEEQLVFYKKNEVVFYDQISVLKRDASFKDSKITALNLQIEKIKKEKESNQIKINNFENASKSLDKLIGRIGLWFIRYNVVAPPPTGLFAPPTIDLSNSGLEEFQHPKFKGYGPKDSKSVCVDTSNEIKNVLDALIIKD
nr:ribonuclease H-like domain-containing protein [Tanacetum cinerariifolium]